MKIDSTKLSNNAADNSFISLMGGGNGIVDMPLNQLIETENQPFNVFDDERMDALVEDIKINGVLEPILVKQDGNKYRILAGHRRTHASKLAGKETIPCIIKNVKSGTEKLIITNTNLTQRKEFLPSELAKAYQMQLEGYQELDAHQVRTTAQIAEENNVSRRTVQYYMKLNNLTDALLELVDEGIITVKAGAGLSNLSSENQNKICKYIKTHPISKVDIDSVENIKAFLRNNPAEGLGNEILVSQLNTVFHQNKKAKSKSSEPMYDTYIVNYQNIEDTMFKARQNIIYLDNSQKLKNSVVLKQKDYQKLQAAQAKIEQQFNLIKQIIEKA